MKKICRIICSMVIILTLLLVNGCATKADREKAEKLTQYLKNGVTFAGEKVEEITSDTYYSSGKSSHNKYFISFYSDGSARVSDYYCIFETKTHKIDGNDRHNYYDTDSFKVVAKGNNRFLLQLSTGEYELSTGENEVFSIKYKDVTLTKGPFVDLKD